MKFTSIIFIFVSVILIFGGIFAMNYARDLAGDDILIDGYSWGDDGKNTSTVSLDDTELSKIALTLKDCNIEITGTKEESYIELINFKPNTYICSTSGKALTVSDDIAITDYLSFDGSGVKFAGVWQTLLSEYNSRKYGSEDSSRSVVIHIKNYEELKQINLELNKCTLRLHNISGNGDIKITANDSKIELTNISSTVLVLDGEKTDYSLLNINSSKFTSALKSGSFTSNELISKNISLELGDLDVSLLKSSFVDFKCKLGKGKLTFSTDYDMTNFARDLETKNGSLIIGGTNSGSSFKSDKDTVYTGSIAVEILEGNMDAVFGNLIILPETEDNENTDTPENNENTEKADSSDNNN